MGLKLYEILLELIFDDKSSAGIKDVLPFENYDEAFNYAKKIEYINNGGSATQFTNRNLESQRKLSLDREGKFYKVYAINELRLVNYKGKKLEVVLK